MPSKNSNAAHALFEFLLGINSIMNALTLSIYSYTKLSLNFLFKKFERYLIEYPSINLKFTLSVDIIVK